jgi:hypothetical protein
MLVSRLQDEEDRVQCKKTDEDGVQEGRRRVEDEEG